jgi:predicted nucleotidyltransferase
MNDEEILQEIVRRLVDATHPDRIVLFGSRARGEAGPDSDYDILIIAPSDLPPYERTPDLYMLLGGLGISKDIVWRTPEEVADWQNVKSHFITTAIREGKVLYDVAA